MKLTKLEQLSKTGIINEARGTSGEYDGSADFTEEFFDLQQHVIAMKKVMKSPRWIRWMKSTDDNFGTKTVSKSNDVLFALNKLDEALRDLDEELDNAA